ncbi:uncharacterized protein LOC142554220 [Primulina tabacum]|uniref:uncharacterized protein LOC142554220 n=1 Tax=Primulina tabacum TaxID=48773 RepID=UPI003F5A6225
MAFWTTARQSKPKLHIFSKELKRCYTLNKVPSNIVNRCISSRTLIPELNNLDFIFRNSQLELLYSVRFFAAPPQANQKKEDVTSGPRLNEQITSQFIRLVSGEDHKVISRFDALGLAKNLKLDLVEVDRFAKPPVCKILDFKKEKYLRQMKDKERAKSKSELKSGAFKEVRFAAKIKQKDLQMKADMVKRLMESGHRVKCTAIEPTGDVDLETLLSRFSALIKDVAVEESEPKVEKKQAFVVVRHVKFGPSKKSSGKKATKASESTRNSSLMDSGSAPTARSPLEENGDIVETGLEIGEVPDSEELLDEDAKANESEWAVFHGAEDFDAVFEIEDEAHDLPRNEQSGIATSPSSSDTSSRPVLESARSHAASYMSTEVPKQGIANRYSRDSSSGISTSDSDTRSSPSIVPRIPTQGKPQFSMNMSPQMRKPQRLEVHSETSKQPSSRSGVRYSPFSSYDTAAQNPMNGAFKVPQQGKQPQVYTDLSPKFRTPVQVEVPANEFSRQDLSRSSIPSSSTKSFGIFCSQPVDTMPESTPEETNRYSKRNPSDSARSRSTKVVSPCRNPPAPEGRWGRFSTDSSSTLIPNKDESLAEIQGR